MHQKFGSVTCNTRRNRNDHNNRNNDKAVREAATEAARQRGTGPTRIARLD